MQILLKDQHVMKNTDGATRQQIEKKTSRILDLTMV